MKINFSLKKHIEKKFYIYLLSIVGASVAIGLTISYRTRLLANQIFTLFISTTQLDVNREKIDENFNKYFGSQIKEFSVNSFATSSFEYSKMYQTVGTNSDLLILSESALTIIDSRQFIDISDIYHNENNYVKDEKEIGIQIYDGESGYLTDAIKYQNEKYYMFINTLTVHSLGITKSGETNIISNILEGMLK